ncbi:hypothetical protein PHYSODRAFT_329841 [Phytophthora sojae]|uniref:Uncharacterized protein n=1 Tax=Phytophthora sojae (strain P6497) TaxID=1094619 RepID=G4Z9F0_PHYSP|nr:hypothetical protein PHYSODRAFT_329841 [Phytophthora sojae]EGZ21951.1 hypothetical protein PHYSODRAFT_329841 [Phytophthora sojae]|eukprot:XP_009524668.1 hypothetical protein PHYSODRAFT_329841 [Phytophthora sojae]
MALNEDEDVPNLDVWNIHFSTHTTKDKLTTGGWVLYLQTASQQWIPRKAGSLYFGLTNPPTDAAARTLNQGLTELNVMTTPGSTYLRIDSRNKKLQVQLQQVKADIQATGPVAALSKDLNAISSVQWGSSAGTALRAAKLMAKTSTTTIYDTHST